MPSGEVYYEGGETKSAHSGTCIPFIVSTNYTSCRCKDTIIEKIYYDRCDITSGV